MLQLFSVIFCQKRDVQHGEASCLSANVYETLFPYQIYLEVYHFS